MVQLHNPTKSKIGVGLIDRTIFIDAGKTESVDLNKEQLDSVLKCSNLVIHGKAEDKAKAEAEEKAKADANKPKR
jgi:hypothetical protein